MTIFQRQDKLKSIANVINHFIDTRQTPPSDEDLKFIAKALLAAGEGMDANEALGIKAQRGERGSKQSRQRAENSDLRQRFALGWIAAARLPKSLGGLGLTLEKAIQEIGENHLSSSQLSHNEPLFGFKESTLGTYWGKHKALRFPIFSLSAESHETNASYLENLNNDLLAQTNTAKK